MKYWDGHGELVDHLVENGLDINRVDYRRTTLLLDACLRQSRASESLCSLYLDNDADPYIANTEGQSPASLDDRYSYGEAIAPPGLSPTVQKTFAFHSPGNSRQNEQSAPLPRVHRSRCGDKQFSKTPYRSAGKHNE